MDCPTSETVAVTERPAPHLVRVHSGHENEPVRRLHRWLSVVLLIAAAALVATLTGVGTAAAQSAGNGLEEQSVNFFDFDPSRGVVRVTIDITLRNVTTDRVDSTGVSRTFFTGYGVAVPVGAENIVATQDGNVLDGNLVSDPEFPAFATYAFDLGAQLFSGQSTSLRVTFDHLGAEPRSPVPWRVNEAYAGFAAFGLGDPGLVTLRISQPFGYEFDEFTDLTGFSASPPDEFGTVVHTRSGMTEDVTITVGLANNDRLVSRPLNVDGVDIQLRSWPDDPEWADFAAARVESGIPELEALIGRPWPVEGNFDVRQSVEPNLAGYAGWFDLRSNEIAVGEELDADTIYHELSHAWFNSRVSTERWLTEGLAQVYAAELIRRDGEEPRTPVAPSAGDPAALQLTDWGDIGSPFEVEEFGYDTSFWVLDQLVDDIGFERTAGVVEALGAGASPYDGVSAVRAPAQDWQRVYDMFVEVGGATTAGELFRTFVVDADDAPLIEQRDLAAAEVASLEERGEPWTLPVGVRNSLELWEIDAVVEGVRDADEVLEQRSILEALEESVGVDEPDTAADPYGRAPRRDTGGIDFSEPMAVLDEAIDLGRQLESRQQQIDPLADVAGVTPPELGTVEGVDDFASAIEAVDEQLHALQRIAEVEEQLADASGIVVTIGRWGSGIERSLDEARTEFEAGDNDGAQATLDSAEDQIDDLAASGALRLSIAGAAAVVLLLLVVLLRRRARNRRFDIGDRVDRDQMMPDHAQ
jgi:hypothetical protein